MEKRRQETVHHINRLIGQLNTLKEYIEEDRRCKEIASLARSISSSAKGLKTRTLKGYILYDLTDGDLDDEAIEELNEQLQLTRS
jgi:DNA-binding FrmR family transcriptional regulator